MSALVSVFQSLISPKFVLKKSGGCWIIVETASAATNIRFEIAAGLSQAFSLDQDGEKVFPFFADALSGTHAVNDAVVVTAVNGEPYFVAVEMKSSKKRVGDALKQIESGRHFVRWARDLLSLHGHWTGGACKFFGVVSLTPRRQVRKGATSRSAELPSPALSPHGGYPYFVLENHPRVSVADLVKKIVEKHGQCKVAV